MKKQSQFKYWPYILIAVLILGFSAFAPFLFSKFYFGPEFNQQTGTIGDTIGGITAPFMSLVGSILVFAALRAQIQANKIVQDQMDKEEIEARIESLNKIEMLSIDLNSIIEDIELRAERIKTYYEKERDKPFEMNVLLRTSSRVYSRIIEFERLSIYKGFKQFPTERTVWIKHYNSMYSLFDYLPDFFQNMYEVYDKHVDDMFKQKMSVRNELLDLMTLSANYLESVRINIQKVNPEDSDCWVLVNNLMHNYHVVINESFDKEGNVLKETDVEKISNVVLLGFIKEIIIARDKNENYDPLVMPIVEKIVAIRKSISLIKQRATEFSRNLEEAHSKLVVDVEKEKPSTLTALKQLKGFIDQQLHNLNQTKN
jgi:hypothetical protein